MSSTKRKVITNRKVKTRAEILKKKQNRRNIIESNEYYNYMIAMLQDVFTMIFSTRLSDADLLSLYRVNKLFYSLITINLTRVRVVKIKFSSLYTINDRYNFASVQCETSMSTKLNEILLNDEVSIIWCKTYISAKNMEKDKLFVTCKSCFKVFDISSHINSANCAFCGKDNIDYKIIK